MELLLLVFFCLLTGSEVTFGAGGVEGGIIEAAANETKVIRVGEGRDITLPCSLNTEDITSEKFVWKKDGRQVFLYDAGDHSNFVPTGQDQQFIQRVSHFPDKLKSGDASITIRDTKVTDTGLFTCDFTNHPGEIFLIFLIVDQIINGGVKAPKPSVMTLNQTDESAVLQCEVRGAFPKPELHWEDGAGNKLPAEEPQESERGRLIILQTTVTKTDRYRCVATYGEDNHQTDAETFVYIHAELKEKTVIIVEEGSVVILPCSLREDITNKKFVWKKDDRQVFLYDAGDHSNIVNTGQDQQFIQRVSHFLDKLKSGIASITIRDTKAADSGLYTCEFPDLQPEQRFLIKLVVAGAVPKPSVRILKQTKDGMQLQCEVRGAFPKPKLHWEDGARNKLPAEKSQETERQGHYDIILKTTVTKTDIYRCVATQEETKRQADAETYVFVPERDILAEILAELKDSNKATLDQINKAEVKPESTTDWKISTVFFVFLFIFALCAIAMQCATHENNQQPRPPQPPLVKDQPKTEMEQTDVMLLEPLHHS